MAACAPTVPAGDPLFARKGCATATGFDRTLGEAPVASPAMRLHGAGPRSRRGLGLTGVVVALIGGAAAWYAVAAGGEAAVDVRRAAVAAGDAVAAPERAAAADPPARPSAARLPRPIRPAPRSPAATAPAPRRERTQKAYRIQLFALSSEAAARRAWRRVRRAHGDVFRGLPAAVVAGRPARGGATVHQLQAGSFPAAAEASAFCRRVRRLRLDCIVVPPSR